MNSCFSLQYQREGQMGIHPPSFPILPFIQNTLQGTPRCLRTSPIHTKYNSAPKGQEFVGMVKDQGKRSGNRRRYDPRPDNFLPPVLSACWTPCPAGRCTKFQSSSACSMHFAAQTDTLFRLPFSPLDKAHPPASSAAKEKL